MQYCIKCGAEINSMTAAHTCELCGAHIYGQTHGYGGAQVFRSSLGGGLAGLIGSAIGNSVQKGKTKSNEEMLSDYLNSDYYRFNQEPIENVLTDKGKVGEYATELWIRGKQREPGLQPLCCPFKILYNVMIPEPDGSFQEIDMVLITQYCLFVFEIKNRNYNIHINHWSDSACTINGEKGYSPIMQNEKHITALRHFLMRPKEGKRDLSYSPAIKPVNVIMMSPFAKADISYPWDDWDTFSMESISVYMLNGYNLTLQLNSIIQELKDIEYIEYIDLDEIYDILYPCCESSNVEKSMSMRYRDEYNKNSQKYPWKYYLIQYNTGLCKIARENGVYKQLYLKERYAAWTFADELTNVKASYGLNNLKTLMSIKKSLDENEYLRIEPNKGNNKLSEAPLKRENPNTKDNNRNSDVMYCPQCGKKINGGNFCKYCGSKLEQ